jgi:TM2 domain-containing membrane protein YozV
MQRFQSGSPPTETEGGEMQKSLARLTLLAAALALVPGVARAQGAATAAMVGPRVELAQAYYTATPATYDTPIVQAADRKDPTVAGLLSWFIPGLGSFYAGHSGHGIRHIAIHVGGLVLLVAGLAAATDDLVCDSFGNCNLEEGSFALAGVGYLVVLANDIWAIITAVGDANAYNRGAGGARPGRVVGSLYLDPSVRALGSNGLRAAGLPQQATTGIQILSVGF